MGSINRLFAARPTMRIAPAAAATMADRQEQPPSRSLIPLTPPHSPRPVGTGSATFLAQLIATKQKLPQTRDRRRADPGDASAAYGVAVQASAGTITGRVVTRIA